MAEIGIIHLIIPGVHGIARQLRLVLVEALEIAFRSPGKIGGFHGHATGGPIFEDVHWDVAPLGKQQHLVGRVGTGHIARMTRREKVHCSRTTILGKVTQHLDSLTHGGIKVGTIGGIVEAAVRVAVASDQILKISEIIGKTSVERVYHGGGIGDTVEVGHKDFVVGSQLATRQELADGTFDKLMLTSADILSLADLHEIFPKDDDMLACLA